MRPTPAPDTGRDDTRPGDDMASREGSVFAALRATGREYLFVGTALLPLATWDAPALAQIPPGESYTEGMTTAWRQTMTGRGEIAFTYAYLPRLKTGEWAHGGASTDRRDRVITDTTEVARAVEATARRHQREGSVEVRACSAHTHSLDAAIAGGILSQEEVDRVKSGAALPPSLPPSGGDISVWGAAVIGFNVVEELQKKGISVTIVKSVVDPAGVTYHRILTDEDRRQHFPAFAAEVDEIRRIFPIWKSKIDPLLRSLDDNALQALHSLTDRSTRYGDKSMDDTEYGTRTIREAKRQDVYIALIKGGNAVMTARILEIDPSLETLLREWDSIAERKVVETGRFPEIREQWTRQSLTVTLDALLQTPLYDALREGYARQGALIRIVPRAQAEKEEPCPPL